VKNVFVTLSVKYGWNLRPTRKSTALAVDRFGPNSQPGTCRTCLLRALSKSHPSTTLYVFFVKWCQDSTQFHTFYSSYDYWSKRLKKIKEEHNIGRVGRLKDLKGFKTDQKNVLLQLLSTSLRLTSLRSSVLIHVVLQRESCSCSWKSQQDVRTSLWSLMWRRSCGTSQYFPAHRSSSA
jgi:hypothetical protein